MLEKYISREKISEKWIKYQLLASLEKNLFSMHKISTHSLPFNILCYTSDSKFVSRLFDANCDTSRFIISDVRLHEAFQENNHEF